ncbi:CRISPR-associated protein Cas4 [Methanobrevibacter filiformis]|uniref:CRISPR-associated exonuclease Cas4 n=1 Tax=Methanobrevibacter filiformis TaxID=55758 RepID=A0A166DR68_9EURY|nr:CRISPR-associated protein Cas4 [Methanobrevibacter filiformis]KZX15869.1 PD-(D/E)XK nuclease superfamily protein [Methanobrevibacter filiformis]
MISISSIKEFAFCPLKLYLRNQLDEETRNNIKVNKTIKQIRVDLQDLLQRNIRSSTKGMSIEEISKNLSRNILETIESLMIPLKKDDSLLNSELEEIKEDLIKETRFNVNFLALKSKKAMTALDKDGTDITEMFFPTSMYSYLIRDNTLEIIGTCDKIEIVDGRYYPVDIKTTNPPLQGVWDSDAIKLVANAMLIEQEFDTEVFVGFIDYIKIAERRPVIMDSKLRKELFKTIHNIKEILEEGAIPEVSINIHKCEKCEYKELCHTEREAYDLT